MGCKSNSILAYYIVITIIIIINAMLNIKLAKNDRTDKSDEADVHVYTACNIEIMFDEYCPGTN